MGREGSLRPHEEVVERTLEWVAVAFLLLNLPLSTVRAFRNPLAYDPAFAFVALTALWLLVGVAVAHRARGRSASVVLRAIVVVGVLVLVLHPLVEGPQPVDYPPLLHVLGAIAAITPVLGVRFSAVLIPAFAAYVAFLRVPVLGLGQAAAEASLLAVSALLATVSVDLLRRANRSVVDAVQSLTAAAESRVRAQRRAYEREHWNGLVHDKVIGALQLVTREQPTACATPSAAAQELAGQSIAAFRGDPLPEDETVGDALDAHGRLLGLDVDISVAGDLPDAEVRGALVEAAKEAFTNVSRHAGTHRARVRGTLDETGALLVVTDSGSGFDVATRPRDRGITTSMIGRMASVGGSAHLISSPGGGTSVRLTWRATPPETLRHQGGEWQLDTFAPAMVLGVLCVILNVVIGAQQWRLDRWPLVTALCLIAIVLVTAAATWPRPADRRLPGLLLAAVLTAGLLTANIPEDAPLDWRYWYLGALTPAVGAVAFRFRRWAGLVMALALTTTVCAADAAAGRPFWASLGGPVPVLFAVAVAGQGIRASMDRAWQRVTNAEDERAKIRLAATVEEERSREAASRVAALTDTVGPWLHKIASGTAISADDRARLALLESSVRDHLAGPDLLDAGLVQALHESRSRGVRVVVVQGSAPPRNGSGEPAVSAQARYAYRRVFGELLRRSQATDTIRAVWGQLAPGTCGTITVVHGEQDAGASHVGDDILTAAVEGVPSRHRPNVTRDEACLLVEFPS